MELLPNEIIEVIFSKVRDKDTLLSLRLLNKHYYFLFKHITDADNYKKYIFHSTCYQTINIVSNKLIDEIVFKPPCGYIYKEYNILGNVTKVIKSDMFKTCKTDYLDYYGIKKINYDVAANKTDETTIAMYPPHNCLIM